MFGVAALATRVGRRTGQLHDPALVAGQNRPVPHGDDREQEDAERAGVHVRGSSVAMRALRRQCCVARTTLRLATVARIVDYERVLQRMEAEGFRSLYHNSGAFGFARGADVKYAGWVGPADASIRAEARAYIRHIESPYEANLSRGVGEVWTEHLPGPTWVMPMSHWSYELDFGSRDWMPAALNAVGVGGDELVTRANGAALEFDVGERAKFQSLLVQLLSNLRTSDFMLAFPGRPTLCTVHHHKQLWWQTTDASLLAALMRYGAAVGSKGAV